MKQGNKGMGRKQQSGERIQKLNNESKIKETKIQTIENKTQRKKKINKYIKI